MPVAEKLQAQSRQRLSPTQRRPDPRVRPGEEGSRLSGIR
jgi:hypothetical protein